VAACTNLFDIRVYAAFPEISVVKLIVNVLANTLEFM
jgi:hypothetical protein